jgi:hypothetical protein
LRSILGATLPAVLGTILLANTAWAQKSSFQSADGETSIFIPSGGLVAFNITDTSLSAGYRRRVSDSPWMWGLAVDARVSSNVADFFHKGRPAPGAGGSVSFGRHEVFSKNIDTQTGAEKLRDDWIVLDVSYHRSTFQQQQISGLDPGPRQRNFDQYGGLVTYNALINTAPAGVLFGVSAGLERRNNLEDLTQVQFAEQITSKFNGGTTTIVQSVNDGYYGDYLERVAVPMNTDLVVLPKALKSRYGFDLFTRSEINGDNKRIEPGLGVFLTDPVRPTNAIAGASVSYLEGHARLAVVVGWNFGK